MRLFCFYLVVTFGTVLALDPLLGREGVLALPYHLFSNNEVAGEALKLLKID